MHHITDAFGFKMSVSDFGCGVLVWFELEIVGFWLFSILLKLNLLKIKIDSSNCTKINYGTQNSRMGSKYKIGILPTFQ